MPSSARMKSKKKAASKKEGKLRTGRRIRVEDLRSGDRIVTSWHESKDDGQTALTADEVMNVLSGSNGSGDGASTIRYVNTSREVKTFDECPGQWRTHVHINRSDCYDMRSYVWIVNE